MRICYDSTPANDNVEAGEYTEDGEEIPDDPLLVEISRIVDPNGPGTRDFRTRRGVVVEVLDGDSDD